VSAIVVALVKALAEAGVEVVDDGVQRKGRA
jgi:hypothetical protein